MNWGSCMEMGCTSWKEPNAVDQLLHQSLRGVTFYRRRAEVLEPAACISALGLLSLASTIIDPRKRTALDVTRDRLETPMT
ncbi:hypothetical protein L210DRAFT_3570465 [Boletus edulis BED1]|uniref:Uncharacterized protein n=2 Tax=Boletus edulis BED1 TaxID=1328754 RepID=A0AAD4G817_BOLED|nr:hypothetical protein L210DRAFT_3570465 [Boletus edulis BED1]